MIETERLRLVPLSLADATAIVHGLRPTGARWADGYPMEGTLVAAGLIVTAEEEGKPFGPWRSYQVVRKEDETVIGDCGFDGPPDPDGDVHLGCAICVVARGHGYGTESVEGLLEWAHAQRGIRHVLAEASSEPAKRVLRGAGMKAYDERSRLVYYQG